MMPVEGRSKEILIVAVVCMSVSFITVCLRSYVRLRLIKAFGWDDGLMVIATVLNIFLTVCAIVGAKEGIGRKLTDFRSMDDLHRAMLWWWLGQLIYMWASGVAKVSIALALLRLTVRQSHRIILWTAICASVTVGLVFWFFMVLQCHPVSEFWERTGRGQCLDTSVLLAVAYVYSSICAACDLALGLLPILLVRKLQINPRTKIALGATLSMGCVACLALIIRIPFLPSYKDLDFLYSTYQIDLWSFLELGLGITAGSLVTLRPLLRKFLDHGASSTPKAPYAYTYTTRSGGTGRKPRSRSRGSFPFSSFSRSRTEKDQDLEVELVDAAWRPDVHGVERSATAMAMATVVGGGGGGVGDLGAGRGRERGKSDSQESLTGMGFQYENTVGGAVGGGQWGTDVVGSERMVRVQKSFYVTETERRV
ncbi:uncharacterized protein BO72DRAFT_514420 [Aspergillus fijiensis CBS 313.89]|uniref:Rhodopsin domain-containing protein n=1 Tax=Aspergillus fijiensis CBS 313.89 TaxID=1448319 RepID=A0A8G1VZN1_9EURO|nr:uncharacterized protein BO72DRAFT_514420 [Aspergillus fijiensis CBS 313.89]RAK75199.1 hypothetical protein BO72DRAFT_514420 [Aspergillus fijiensis CBS 313.89]